MAPFCNYELCSQLVNDSKNKCLKRLKQAVVLRSVPCPENLEGGRVKSSCPVGSKASRVISYIGLASSPKGCRRSY